MHVIPKPSVALLTMVLLGVLALGTRFWGIADRSINEGEAYSWLLANMSLSDMLDATAADRHPPFYYGVLHFWVDLAGNSEAALRALSAIAGAATIILLALVAWRIGGRLLGVTAAALLLLNPTYLYVSQEVRMYPLTGLLALAATAALAGFITRPSPVRLVVYTFLAVCLVYTHYSGLLVMPIHGLLFAAYGVERFWRKRDPWVLTGGALAFTLIGISYLPWLSNFRKTADLGVPSSYPEPSWDLVSELMRLSVGLREAESLWPLFAIPLVALGAWGIGRRWRDPWAVCLGALALVLVGQVLISIVIKPILNFRQISPYIPAVAFVSAVGLVEAVALVNRFRGTVRLASASVLFMGVAALAILMFMGTINTYPGPKRDWRQLAGVVQQESRPIFMWPHFLRDPLRYYLGDDIDAVAPINSRTIQSMRHGFVPVPRERPGDESVLILGCPDCTGILAAFRPYFSVGEPTKHPGFMLVYRIRSIATAEYNVNVFNTAKASERWTATPEGHLKTIGGGRNVFRLRFPVDKDGDGGVDKRFTLHIEYLDAGPASFSLAGFKPENRWDDPVVLAEVSIDGTNSWRSVGVPVEKGSALSDRFFLTSGVTIRTLEVRRYELDGVKVTRASANKDRSWFLRPDGYLETVSQTNCIRPVVPAGGGASSLVMDLMYLDDGKWTDMSASMPVESRVCPPALRGQLVVRRLVVRPGP